MSKNYKLDPTQKELYNTIETCYEMLTSHDTQRLANHKLNELVEEHGKEAIVYLMERVRDKKRR